MTVTAWIFMGTVFVLIVGVTGISLNKILKNNK